MVLTLYTVSKKPEVAAIIGTVRISKPSIDTEIATFKDNNFKKNDHVLTTNHINCRANDDKRLFINSIFVACAFSSELNKNKPS